MNIIETNNLIKKFSYPLKTNNWLNDLLKPQQKEIIAVDNLNLNIAKGESVAFIGPNGAGKSTTIKMLTGILVPSSGQLSVAGYNPTQMRSDFARKIGIVFAQRSQLIFNLPLYDSFRLFASMYDISDSLLKKRFAELVEIFALQEFINQPVRKLSLGQRMRAEVALSLLHKPEIVFLDEPTVGLDILAKKKLRQALKDMNSEHKVTIFLTSHDVGDIETVSERTIIINHGKILIDENTQKIRKMVASKKNVIIEFARPVGNITYPGLTTIKREENRTTFELNTEVASINQLMQFMTKQYELLDINIDDPKLEDIIGDIYQHE